MDRRQFLAAAGSAAAFAVAPGVLARAPLAGEASRKGPDVVELTWTQGPPATVRVSADPDAAPGAMRLLQSGVRAGRLEAAAPISPRPYFLVSTSDGGQVRLAERLLPLAGGRNFRDLGGYRAADGRQVRWGKLFRSGVMSGLTAGDMRYLAGIGLRVICDLRSIGERTRQPNPFIAQGGEGAPHVVATDYEMFKLDALHDSRTRQQAIEGFSDAYVDFSRRLTPQYSDMFDRLVRGEAPLAFNCSAGKDRTGLAAALILSLLGVPRETVIADYALTQVYSPPGDYSKLQATAASAGLSPEQVAMFSRMPPEVLAVMGGSDPAIMRRTLAKIDAGYGGPVALAKSRYGLTDEKIARLRQLYLS
jgi:protein-tyrosine phosphatase